MIANRKPTLVRLNADCSWRCQCQGPNPDIPCLWDPTEERRPSMKFLAKFTSIFCLFGLSAMLGGTWALAQQAAPAQQTTPAADGPATTGVPDPAGNATSKKM